MASKEESMLELYDIGAKFRVIGNGTFQDFDFNLCLPIKLSFISNNLECYYLLLFVIECLKNLPKGAMS
jgi:hypothetical protein